MKYKLSAETHDYKEVSNETDDTVNMRLLAMAMARFAKGYKAEVHQSDILLFTVIFRPDLYNTGRCYFEFIPNMQDTIEIVNLSTTTGW